MDMQAGAGSWNLPGLGVHVHRHEWTRKQTAFSRNRVVLRPQVLLTYKGQDIGVLEVESKWLPNKAKETKECYLSSSLEHPGVQMVSMERGKYYLGGKVWGLDLPKR
jgi:ATP sulfurylase